MRTLILRTILVSVGSMVVLGCGNPTPPANAQKGIVIVPQRPADATGTVVTPSPSTKTGSIPKSGKSYSKPAAAKKSAIPANADPRTIFLVSGNGEPMEVISTRGVLPTDEFEIAAADLNGDSTKFVVDSIRPSTSTQSLIGPGQPKSGFTLPKGFTAVKEVGYSTEGLPLRILCAKSGSTLALVSAGTSIVGTDAGPEECTPSFSVHLDAFYMEMMEVTLHDYEKFRAEMREKKKPVPPAPSNPSAVSNTPALGVTWAGAQNYVRWVGMELPTEAEWEKAARGPNGLRTPWGDGKPLWSNRALTTGGAYPTDSSPYGILDLAGNAKEWCADLYSVTDHSDAAIAASRESLYNWAGPKKSRDMNLRVVKGNGRDWSAWHREGKDMSKAHFDVGFRGVLRIPPDSKSTTSPKPPSS